jgi:hypothetical protein
MRSGIGVFQLIIRDSITLRYGGATKIDSRFSP